VRARKNIVLANLNSLEFSLWFHDVSPRKEGAHMTRRSRKPNPLADIFRSQREEIEKYKWIESEKAGSDIGWERATREWLSKHFPEWKRYRWQHAVAEALSAESNGLN